MSAPQIFCPSCGHQQSLGDKCEKCGYAFPAPRPAVAHEVEATKTVAAAATPTAGSDTVFAAKDGGEPAHPVRHRPERPAHHAMTPPGSIAPAPRPQSMVARNLVIGLAVVIVGGLGALMLRKPAPIEALPPTEVAPEPAAQATPRLGGDWSGRASSKGRTATVKLTSDDAGEIVGAEVAIEDADGGVIAGFHRAGGGEQLIHDLMATFDPKTKQVDADLPFLKFGSWAAAGPRTFKAIEGVERVPKKIPENVTDLSMFVDYLVLESTEPDVLLQAGISRSGVVVFLNGSRSYLLDLGHGKDVVNQFVRPGSGQKIDRFEDLIFDLTGGLNFVKGRVEGTIASPTRPSEPIGFSLGKS